MTVTELFATCTFRELKAIAKENGIANNSRFLNKADLLAAIQAHFARENEPEDMTETTVTLDKEMTEATATLSAENEQFIPDYLPVEQVRAASLSLEWLAFAATATLSTARAIAHAPETRAFLLALWTGLCYAIALTIYAGRVAGRIWRSERAVHIRWQMERWFTGQVMESIGTMSWKVPPVSGTVYDYEKLSDLARSALS